MKISVIGAGAMGGATVEGLIKGQQFRNEDICQNGHLCHNR